MDFDDDCRILPVRDRAVFFPGGSSDLRALPTLEQFDRAFAGGFSAAEMVPVGLIGGRSVLAVDLGGVGDGASAEVAVFPQLLTELGLEELPLRSLLGTEADPRFRLSARAIHICHWRRGAKFCGTCGARTSLPDEELASVCGECGMVQYPRISPAVITAITRTNSAGELEILLAKHRGRASAFYGLIAGFVEPGESAEEAVHREVHEETGLSVRNLEYICSQPWPFPDSLMIGFRAEYGSGYLQMQESELEDLGWFAKDRLPPLSPPGSLSRRLTDLVFA